MTALRVDHIGIACRSAEATARFYTEGLGLSVVSRETLDEMKLKVIKVGCGETVMELLEPLEGESADAGDDEEARPTGKAKYQTDTRGKKKERRDAKERRRKVRYEDDRRSGEDRRPSKK